MRRGRAVCAAALACALALPASARAGEPATDELAAAAVGHVKKAEEHHRAQRYKDAEEEFKRAAYFTPNWRPLHFNLAVLAEAQGRLGAALTEYRAFRPLAEGAEERLVDQRIDELTARRAKIAGHYRRQLAGASIGVAICGGAVAGAVALFVVGHAKGERGEISDKERGGYYGGGVLLGLYGVVGVMGIGVVLEHALKSKRKLEGLALGPTRLQWSGGLGARLRF